MKFAFGIAVFLWVLCGGIGAWMMDDFSIHDWKEIARGPITLHEALAEHPVTYPGPT